MEDSVKVLQKKKKKKGYSITRNRNSPYELLTQDLGKRRPHHKENFTAEMPLPTPPSEQ